jgi:hypothetical protein
VCREVALIVVDEASGEEKPGWALRAGDRIERTHYDHNTATVRAVVASGRTTLFGHLRLWWEGLWDG